MATNDSWQRAVVLRTRPSTGLAHERPCSRRRSQFRIRRNLVGRCENNSPDPIREKDGDRPHAAYLYTEKRNPHGVEDFGEAHGPDQPRSPPGPSSVDPRSRSVAGADTNGRSQAPFFSRRLGGIKQTDASSSRGPSRSSRSRDPDPSLARARARDWSPGKRVTDKRPDRAGSHHGWLFGKAPGHEARDQAGCRDSRRQRTEGYLALVEPLPEGVTFAKHLTKHTFTSLKPASFVTGTWMAFRCPSRAYLRNGSVPQCQSPGEGLPGLAAVRDALPSVIPRAYRFEASSGDRASWQRLACEVARAGLGPPRAQQLPHTLRGEGPIAGRAMTRGVQLVGHPAGGPTRGVPAPHALPHRRRVGDLLPPVAPLG